MNFKSEEKRDLILDAARRVFGERGFSQTRLSDVAEDAGIAKGTVYIYFSSKEELFREMAVRQFLQFEQHAHSIIAQYPDDFYQVMFELSTFHLEFALNPQSARLWEMSRFEHDQALNAELQHFLSRYMQLIRQRMEKEQMRDAAMSALAFMGMNESFKMEAMMGEMNLERADFIEKRARFVADLMELNRKKT